MVLASSVDIDELDSVTPRVIVNWSSGTPKRSKYWADTAISSAKDAIEEQPDGNYTPPTSQAMRYLLSKTPFIEGVPP